MVVVLVVVLTSPTAVMPEIALVTAMSGEWSAWATPQTV